MKANKTPKLVSEDYSPQQQPVAKTLNFSYYSVYTSDAKMYWKLRNLKMFYMKQGFIKLSH